MARSMETRIDSLARRDRVLAVTFAALMWGSLVFVFAMSNAVAPSPGVTVALLLSLVVLGLFNTASVVGMVRAYAANKELIYRQDILNHERGRLSGAREDGEHDAS